MRLLSIIAVTAIATFTLIAADLAGTWKGSMKTQIGESAVAIMIKPGADLAGKIQAGEYEGTIEHARISGDKISFDVRIDPGTLTFEGTVSGNQMKLEVTGTQGDKYTLVCTRQ